jgi:hypothetical protein
MLTVNSVETWIIERLELDFKKQNVCSESIAAMRYTLLGRNNRKANKTNEGQRHKTSTAGFAHSGAGDKHFTTSSAGQEA